MAKRKAKKKMAKKKTTKKTAAAARSEKALAAVGRVLKKKPKATTEELRKAAERADAAIKTLSRRSFHASYALPAKRTAGLVAKGGRPKGGARTKKKVTRRKVTRGRADRAKVVDRVQVFRARRAAGLAIQDLLLNHGIVDDASHEEAMRVAQQIVRDVGKSLGRG